MNKKKKILIFVSHMLVLPSIIALPVALTNCSDQKINQEIFDLSLIKSDSELVQNETLNIPSNYCFITNSLNPDLKIKIIKFDNNSLIQQIPDNAFSNCINLENIYLPNSLIKIGNNSFKNCHSLKNINFGNSSKLSSIGDYAFYGCSLITELSLLDSIEEIGKFAFAKCSMLSNINIPEKLTVISESLFQDTLIQTIDLKNVIKVEKNAFRDCGLLETALLSKKNNIIDDFAFYNCYSMYNINFSYTTQIGYNALGLCFRLSVESLQSLNCKFNNEIFWEGNEQEIGLASWQWSINNEHHKRDGNHAFNLSDKYLIEKYSQWDVTGNFLILTIPSYYLSFKGELNPSLPIYSVDLSNTKIMEIKENAFINCENLRYVAFPNTIKYINKKSFMNSSVVRIDLRNCHSLIKIGDASFMNCKKLELIYLPKRSIDMASNAIDNCNPNLNIIVS